MQNKIRSHQQALVDKILARFEISCKVILNGICGIGKTFISLYLISIWVSKGSRVLVFTSSMNGIKFQWLAQILRHNALTRGSFKIVCSEDTYAQHKNNPDVCTIKMLSEDIRVVLILPQTVRKSAKFLGKFDYIIVDEAHAYLDVVDSKRPGTLKTIINLCSTPKTKVLGLTATAFELLTGRGFFSGIADDDCVMYDIQDALNANLVCDVKIHVSKFDFDIAEDYYKSDGDLTKAGEDLVRDKTHNSVKVEDILKIVQGKAIVITLPLQDRDIYDFINLKFGVGSCVLNSMRAEDADAAELQFKNDPNVKFMVVINKCGVGYDFSELVNVVDLTFTKSHKLQIQRMLRTGRLSDVLPDKVGHYYYCCDQSSEDNSIRYNIGKSLWLMRKEGILAYKNMVEARTMSVLSPVFRHTNTETTYMSVSVKEWMIDYEIKYSKRTLALSLQGCNNTINELYKFLSWASVEEMTSPQFLSLSSFLSSKVITVSLDDFRTYLKNNFSRIYDKYEKFGMILNPDVEHFLC